MRKGITLVSMVITIIVLIILTSVVVMSNNIINNAKEATFKNNLKNYQEQLTNNILLEQLKGNVSSKNEINVNSMFFESTKSEVISEKGIKDWIPSLEKSLKGKVEISNGLIFYISQNSYDEERIEWAREINMYNSSENVEVEEGITISNIKIVANSDGSGVDVDSNTYARGNALYINFSNEFAPENTTVTPSLPYRITKNGKYTFSVITNFDGVEYSKNITISVNKYSSLLDLPVTYDTGAKIDVDAIGTKASNENFRVLTHNVSGYDESGLLYFDLSNNDFNLDNIKSVKLYAYYYNGDIPERQQTHPVRKIITPWTEGTILTYDHMSNVSEGVMTSINTSGYGYGWRSCDITSLFAEWVNNPETNYGLVIDNNRQTSNDGGYWNSMKYYTQEYNQGQYTPKLVIEYK